MDNLKAIAEAEKRLLEDTIRALREKLENSAADTLAQIENLRADQDGNRREAESNIQALRNKLEQQRNQYEEKLDNDVKFSFAHLHVHSQYSILQATSSKYNKESK